jgi:hypothetical protein
MKVGERRASARSPLIADRAGIASPDRDSATLLVAGAFVFAVLAWRRATLQRGHRSPLDDADAGGVDDAARKLRPRLIWRAMHPEAQAELILARLSVQDFVRARVTDEGDIAYSTRDLPLPRARVGDGGDEQPLADEHAPATAEVDRAVIPDRQR